MTFASNGRSALYYRKCRERYRAIIVLYVGRLYYCVQISMYIILEMLREKHRGKEPRKVCNRILHKYVTSRSRGNARQLHVTLFAAAYI